MYTAYTSGMVVSRPGGRIMPKQSRGIEKRDAILRELYRRELALEPPPTVEDLAQSIGTPDKRVGVKTIYYHLVALRDEGLVTWVPLAARTLKLTPKGRAEVTKA